jgi:K(+)-stimulated pyrophosphate-energized sodium pump
MLVKITDDNAKKHKFKSIKYRKLGFDRLTAIACYFLVQYMLPETMKMDFFGEGTKEISSMRVFMRQLLDCCWCSYFIGYGILYGLRDKTSYGNCTKSSTGQEPM